MQIFPTQYSLLSSLALNGYIHKSYGLTGTSCKLLIHNVSDTYLLEDAKNKYIFKIYRDAHRTVEEIKAEVELLNLLKDGGAKVSFPLKDLQGEYLQHFNAAEGTRYGVLFSFAKGKVVYDLSPEQLTTIGVEMAKIHNITSTVKLRYPRRTYTVETTLTAPIKTIQPAFKGLDEDYKWLANTAAKVGEKIAEFDPVNFSTGYCHYDFLPKNFHFAADDEITFFDFDFAGTGPLANDLASFYIHFFIEVYSKKITQEKADECFQVFIEAYRSVRPLTDQEIKAIPYFGFAFWLFYFQFHYEHFEDWSNFFFTPKFIKDRVALIKQWTSWYCPDIK
jgi:Ser/Thr protein kinase RdoA (MazF antagonist)